MGGFFGVVSQTDCVVDLFYGTDYHSHLGTRRGGLTVVNGAGFDRYIHDITNAQFRTKFETDVGRLRGRMGIGVISDHEDQPLIVSSHLGTYAIATVGKVANIKNLAKLAFQNKIAHFSEMSGNRINPTELIASLINQGNSFVDGIRNAQEHVKGSCSMLLLTERGLFVARDKLGRTPLIIGRRENSVAATLETCAFPNLGYTDEMFLGPGEIAFIAPDGIVSTLQAPGSRLQICAFLWIYYGYPSSTYEGINVELSRNRCGAALARRNTTPVDIVAGIPDSGTGHAIGFASQAGLPLARPFVKYTPTWPRSFTPQDQATRNLVARMKLIPVQAIIQGRRMLFCEDSIVRGTQLRETIRRLFYYGAREVHMRPASPPLIYGCKFLNFTQSHAELDLAARRAIVELEGKEDVNLEEYAGGCVNKVCAMVERIRSMLGLTSLSYQRIDDMVEAIGLPKDKLCTYCWDGTE